MTVVAPWTQKVWCLGHKVHEIYTHQVCISHKCKLDLSVLVPRLTVRQKEDYGVLGYDGHNQYLTKQAFKNLKYCQGFSYQEPTQAVHLDNYGA